MQGWRGLACIAPVGIARRGDAMDRLSTFLPQPAVPTSTNLVREPLPATAPGAGGLARSHPGTTHGHRPASAPLFTLLHDEHGTGGRFAGHTVTTSPLQRLGIDQASFRRLLPLYPSAVERLKLPPSDVVLSSSSAFAHGVRVPEGAVHVCYCYTPFRYVWDEESYALSEISPLLRPLLRSQLRRIRKWDLAASSRVDAY